MQFSGVREAAELYISLGFRVVPLYGVDAEGCACRQPECKPRDWGKHTDGCTEDRWKSGEELTPEEFSAAPGAHNIALAMGPWGGSDGWLVCLDIDGELDPEEHLCTRLPPTLTQKSPRGRHLIFEVEPYRPLGNWVDVLRTKPGPSLDLRYARGRIVVAPSLGASGAYEWETFREPAPLPEAVIEQILARRLERGLPVQASWERGDKRP